MNYLGMKYLINIIREYEIDLHEAMQHKYYLNGVGKFLLSVNINTDSSKFLDIYVPLTGAFNDNLMIKLINMLSVINLCTSLIKWSLPAHRPYWWLHKSEYLNNYQKQVEHFPSTCKVSAGFPCSDCATFTCFTYITFSFILTRVLPKKYVNVIRDTLIIICSFVMWSSHIYVVTQFLHQCVAGTFLALYLTKILDKYIYCRGKLRRIWLISVATFSGVVIPIAIYFLMLTLNIDPHWSVRMGIEWCKNMNFLHHETGPIFIMARDYGYIMGAALSPSPSLTKRHCSIRNLFRRILFVFLLIILNKFVRLARPKNYGRFIFVSYECLRNLLHSYILLTILPKIST